MNHDWKKGKSFWNELCEKKIKFKFKKKKNVNVLYVNYVMIYIWSSSDYFVRIEGMLLVDVTNVFFMKLLLQL